MQQPSTRKSTLLPTLLATTVTALLAAGNTFAVSEPMSNQNWWPDQLNLAPLRAQAAESNPYGADFDYAEAFAKVDLEALKKDIAATMTD